MVGRFENILQYAGGFIGGATGLLSCPYLNLVGLLKMPVIVTRGAVFGGATGKAIGRWIDRGDEIADKANNLGQKTVDLVNKVNNGAEEAKTLLGRVNQFGQRINSGIAMGFGCGLSGAAILLFKFVVNCNPVDQNEEIIRWISLAVATSGVSLIVISVGMMCAPAPSFGSQNRSSG